jgi:ribosomal protein S18 acetylase RimI-like enzyme
MYIYNLREDDFDRIIDLGEEVHGKNYLDHAALETILRKSVDRGLNCSYVAYDGFREDSKLIGFRLTYAPGKWEIDEWCSPDKWKVAPEKVCYFKTNTVAAAYRGKGLGTLLLNTSINTVRRLGGEAGLTHIWLRSPGNSAWRYFTKAGGKMVKTWPAKWAGDYEKDGYLCILDGKNCVCDGAEMILYF